MIKDPQQNVETPYELLGLPANASRTEVQGALPKFMRDRRNIPRLGKAQDAVRKLQNAKARAAIDIFFYEVNLAAAGAGAADAPPPDFSEFQRIPVLRVDQLYNDLDGGRVTADFRQVTPTQIKFSEVKVFDGLDDVHIRPRFDR